MKHSKEVFLNSMFFRKAIKELSSQLIQYGAKLSFKSHSNIICSLDLLKSFLIIFNAKVLLKNLTVLCALYLLSLRDCIKLYNHKTKNFHAVLNYYYIVNKTNIFLLLQKI